MAVVDPKAWRELNQLHYERFGVYPVRTGINFFKGPEYVEEKIREAIEKGEPYVEPPVPKGAVV